ncbi:WhiB family transcriptional regulator [Streptomyces sp. NPDC001156]
MSHYTGSVPATEPAADWRTFAACRKEDPDLFFPVGSDSRGRVGAAQAVCHGCPVQQPCGQWALETRQQWGVWGGLSENQRRQILKRRGVRLFGDPEGSG